ncbi:hypothetical protein [Nocardia farcinica]|uniref:hypothetical protein n=1 Tax=Nocardia farcinica TaxID=37329 RepID=UPI0024578A26|nr:hypothetical protein [Nocardia farcinica]
MKPKSIVAPIRTGKDWRWIVIPPRRPLVFIPFALEVEAHDTARDLERRQPRIPAHYYLHFPLTPEIRARLADDIAELTRRLDRSVA